MTNKIVAALTFILLPLAFATSALAYSESGPAPYKIIASTNVVALRARRPGRWHVHALALDSDENVASESGGPIIGPGQEVESDSLEAGYDGDSVEDGAIDTKNSEIVGEGQNSLPENDLITNQSAALRYSESSFR